MLPIDKMIITQTFTMARWQIVVKPSEATKPTKTKKNTHKKHNNTYSFTSRRRVRAERSLQFTSVVKKDV